MTKLLIAILLLVAGFKPVADIRTFVYKYDFANGAEQDEEEKQEVKKQEKGKHNTEDKFYFYNVSNPAIQWMLIASSKTNLQQDIYIGFVGKPITPPPDML